MNLILRYAFILVITAIMLFAYAWGQTSNPDTESKQAVADKYSGIYFEVEISAAGGQPVTWKNWRDGKLYRGESDLGGNPTITIVDNEFSYSLSPNIKVARKSKIVKDENKNPLASKYAQLADIPQLDPINYSNLIRRLGAQLQGISDVDGKKADLFTLKITDAKNFPWNNFLIWIDKETSLPIKIQYQDGSEIRTIKFLKIERNIKIDTSKFKVPSEYKLIEFEWE